MSKKTDNLDIYRKDYAKRYFLDIADRDYLAARVLFRHKFIEQSLYISQQCIEKYLKSILLFNNEPQGKVDNSSGHVKKYTHDLQHLKSIINTKLQITFDDRSDNFIENINYPNSFRYLDTNISFKSTYLFDLDHTVFNIRFFCKSNSSLSEINSDAFMEIEKALYKNGKSITGGVLEKIIKNKKKPEYKNSYQNLSWNNKYFVNRKNTSKGFAFKVAGNSSPFNGENEISRNYYEALKGYIYFSSSFTNFYEKNEEKPKGMKNDFIISRKTFD